MSEKTRKTLVFGMLIGSLIWAYFNFSGRKAKRAADRRPRPAAVQPAVVPPQAYILDSNAAAEYEMKSWGKDPFYHAHSTEARQVVPDRVKLHLLGILYREVDAQALINGRVVSVGDTLSGFRVDRIERDHVKISGGGKTITLRVEKEQS